MTARLATGTRNAMTNAAVDQLDPGGTIKVYTGAQPATPEMAATGTLLATFTLPAPAFGTSSTGSAALLGVPLSATAAATGSAGWFRAATTGGTVVFDGSCALTGGQLNMNTLEFTAGETAYITSGSFVQPAG